MTTSWCRNPSTGEIDYANMTGGTFQGWGAVATTPGYTAHTGPANAGGGAVSVGAAELGIPSSSGSALLAAATMQALPQHLGAVE